MKKIFTVLDFLFIITIFVSLTYPKEFLNVANTIYGKFIAVFIIILYTHINKIYGLFVCLLIIYYYQTIYIDELVKFYNTTVESFAELNPVYSETLETPEIYETVRFDKSDSSIYNLVEYENNKDTILLNSIENTIDNINVDNSNSNNDNNISVKQKFIDETCINNHPYYKSFLVRTDMIRHIFPEVKFYKKECNICDKKCGFSIEDKLSAQEELQKPKHSNDHIESTYLERMKTVAFQSFNYIDAVSDHIFDFI